MLASRSTIAGWRSGRRRISTSLNLAAIDMVKSSWRLKIEAAMFENIVGDRFGGDDADWLAVSDDRHVTIFAYSHFIDDHPDRISLSDRFGAFGHHFAHGQRIQVHLAPGDFIEQIALGQDAD